MTISIPYPPVNGQVADGTQMNANLMALVNGLNAALPLIGGSISGALTIGGTLGVVGALTAASNVSVGGTLSVTGAASTGALTVTGAVAASGAIQSGPATGGTGYAVLSPGTATATGLLGFYNTAGVLQGTVGSALTNGTINHVNSTNNGHAFTGGPVTMSNALSTGGAITSGGNLNAPSGSLTTAQGTMSAFITSSGSNAVGNWERWSNGKIVQWGLLALNASGGNAGNTSFVFPIPFITGVQSATATHTSSSTSMTIAANPLAGSVLTSGSINYDTKAAGTPVPSGLTASWSFVGA